MSDKTATQAFNWAVVVNGQNLRGKSSGPVEYETLVTRRRPTSSR